ncbi:hypothetical protein BMS3Abin15_01210 [bacterium BMS3Abin15]|nr:hypothetical protein BMS3Abin15_01210 [bacterium BMS3Abin15]HDH07682.1 hypothetical protein [Candidatus Moranbacteria bacterium]HDZ85873.1 hypothetical protein [Candidatus Moranbacteria bacterium]
MSLLDVTSASFVELWERFIDFLPSLIGAALVFVIGWIIAVFLGRIAERIIKAIRIDQVVEKMRLGEKFKDAGVELNVSGFFGGLVKWFLILVFLMAATDILGLSQVTSFLNSIILYIPNVVVATIILSIAFLVGNLVYNIVRPSTKIAGIMSATLLAVISKWAIVIFGLLAALIQLGIAVSLVNTIFIGIVAALSIALGLSFGLGGKEEAARVLKKIREEIEEIN